MRLLLRSSSLAFLERLILRVYNDARVRTTPVGKGRGVNAKTVLLLGWGGARPRHLRRLEDWYTKELGLTCVSFIMPLWAPGFVRGALIKNVMTTLQEVAPIQHVHCYSNNGMWTCAELLKAGSTFPRLVVDSAPWFLYERPTVALEATLLSKVLTSVVTSGKIEHAMISPILRVVLLFACSLSRLVEKLQNVMIPGKSPFVQDLIGLSKYLRDHLDVKTLFLYSQDDVLIPPSFVRDFMTSLESRGISVSSVEFPSGGHTGGFWAHNQEYKKTVADFLTSSSGNQSHLRLGQKQHYSLAK